MAQMTHRDRYLGKFEFAPCLTEYSGTQSAHIHVDTFKKCQLTFGHPAVIDTGSCKYMCSLWPGFHKTLLLDQLVMKGFEAFTHSQCSVEILDRKCSPFEKVSVEVVLTNSALDSFGLDMKSTKLNKVVAALLKRKHVGVGYTVLSNKLKFGKKVGICQINIMKCEPDVPAAMVSKTTEVTIQSVISEIRFLQKKEFESLKLGGVASDMSNVIKRVKMSERHDIYSMTSSGKLQAVPNMLCKFNFLIRGPSGNGKTEFVKMVARECGAYLYTVASSYCVGSRSAETGDRLQKVIKEVHRLSAEGLCLILFEDVDVFCPRERQNNKGSLLHDRTLAIFTNALDQVSFDYWFLVVKNQCLQH